MRDWGGNLSPCVCVSVKPWWHSGVFIWDPFLWTLRTLEVWVWGQCGTSSEGQGSRDLDPVRGHKGPAKACVQRDRKGSTHTYSYTQETKQKLLQFLGCTWSSRGVFLRHVMWRSYDRHPLLFCLKVMLPPVITTHASAFITQTPTWTFLQNSGCRVSRDMAVYTFDGNKLN
jgi:hypothetical protein